MTTSPQSHRFYIAFLLFFGGLGGMLYGYDIGVISGALLFMNNELGLTAHHESLIVASVLFGGALATLVTGFLADMFGRKKIIIASSIIFLIGLLLIIKADSFMAVLIARLIQGAGIGMEIIVLPLYLTETMPKALRGRSVTLFQLFLTMGIVLAYFVNFIFTPSGNWRDMFLCVFFPGALLLVGAFIATESPRWLYSKNKKNQAYTALLKTRELTEAEYDLDEMKMLSNKQHNIVQKFQRYQLLPFVIALSIACLNQLTGINSVLQFGATILKSAGLNSNITATLGTVGVGVINMLATVLALILIDKVGRKILLSIGTAGVVCSLIFLGWISATGTASIHDGYLILIGLICYIAFFAVGPGVVVWLAISELLPMSIRGKGMAICLFVNCLVSAILASFFTTLVSQIHYSGVFFLCAGFTAIYFLIAVLLLPETKNKSLEDIELYFQHKHEKKI
jgi:SP family galactose:H+ symporter-like MFS transporter